MADATCVLLHTLLCSVAAPALVLALQWPLWPALFQIQLSQIRCSQELHGREFQGRTLAVKVDKFV